MVTFQKRTLRILISRKENEKKKKILALRICDFLHINTVFGKPEKY
jgi:hypothetical protein